MHCVYFFSVSIAYFYFSMLFYYKQFNLHVGIHSKQMFSSYNLPTYFFHTILIFDAYITI